MKIYAVLPALALAACGGAEMEFGSAEAALETAAGWAALSLANDQRRTTYATLDQTCAIRSDSARQIIKHRDGHDKKPFTKDDNLIQSREELLSIAMVGPWTADALGACANRLLFWPTWNDPSHVIRWVDSYEQMDAGLADTVRMLDGWSKGYEEQYAEGRMHFADVEIHYRNGVLDYYEVSFVQTLGEGVALLVIYRLDAGYNVFYEDFYI